jgi:hypothetical protein
MFNRFDAMAFHAPWKRQAVLWEDSRAKYLT